MIKIIHFQVYPGNHEVSCYNTMSLVEIEGELVTARTLYGGNRTGHLLEHHVCSGNRTIVTARTLCGGNRTSHLLEHHICGGNRRRTSHF